MMRNEYDLLASFLEDYRYLGVVRFVIVDNDSSDGSCELLLQQPDVDVYHAAGSYERQEASGCCMSMPTNSSSMTQCEQYPLPRLVEHLEAVDHTKRLAPMTDLYRHPDRSPDLFFDGVPEHHQKSDRGSHTEGALSRYRTAVLHNHDAYPCLTKYPLALYGARTASQGVGLGVLFPFALRDAEENNPSTVRISSQRDRKRWVRLAVTGCVIGR